MAGEDRELAESVARAAQLQGVAEGLARVLAPLKIVELLVTVSGTRESGRATLTGRAPTTMEREYAAAILEGAGWKVNNLLVAVRDADAERITWLLGQGTAQQTKGNLAGAMRLFEAATVAAPAHRQAWGMLGQVQSELGRADEALVSMRRWKALTPPQLKK